MAVVKNTLKKMVLIKGKVENGALRPDKALEGYEGKSVIIMLVETQERNLQPTKKALSMDESWDKFEQLLESCQMDAGIEDLAHQHDHYIYGTPKREPYP